MINIKWTKFNESYPNSENPYEKYTGLLVIAKEDCREDDDFKSEILDREGN